jgi:hypothetical protein
MPQVGVGSLQRVTTFEILDEQVKLARMTFDAAGVTAVIELVYGDALALLPECKDTGFCLLDVCSYCGAEYPDDATMCAIDHTPFECPPETPT